MKRGFAIHIGLQKTATTYLQEILFPSIKNVLVIRGWHSHRRLISSNLEKQIILSDEGLSGSLWNGNCLKEFQSNLKKIKRLYQSPKLIFGIRKQSSFILSVYKQYLQAQGSKELTYLFNENNAGLLKKQDLLWMPRINFLKKEFKDVFIYSLEELSEREEDFVSGLCRFLAIKNERIGNGSKDQRPNTGVKTMAQVQALIRLNRLNQSLKKIHPQLSLYAKPLKRINITPRNFCQKGFMARIPSRKFEMPEALKNFIDLYYRDDWEEAQKAISF